MKHLLIILSLLASGPVLAKELNVGDPAPKVTGINEDGQNLKFEDLYKQGKLVVFFYPKAGTSGCTAQACSLRDAYEKLKEKGVNIVGVSTDKVEAQKEFKKNNHLPYPLISDTKKEVTAAFGVPTTLGFASRQAFLIVDGKIAWLDRKASTDKQAQDIMAVLEKSAHP